MEAFELKEEALAVEICRQGICVLGFAQGKIGVFSKGECVEIQLKNCTAAVERIERVSASNCIIICKEQEKGLEGGEKARLFLLNVQSLGVVELVANFGIVDCVVEPAKVLEDNLPSKYVPASFLAVLSHQNCIYSASVARACDLLEAHAIDVELEGEDTLPLQSTRLQVEKMLICHKSVKKFAFLKPKTLFITAQDNSNKTVSL
jgi:hypothetical protein